MIKPVNAVAACIITIFVFALVWYTCFGPRNRRYRRYYQKEKENKPNRYVRFQSGSKIDQPKAEACFKKYGTMLQTIENMSETRDMYMGFAENMAANLDHQAEITILDQLQEFDKSLLKAKRDVCSEIETGDCCGPLSAYYRNYRSSWLPVCSNCSSKDNKDHIRSKKGLGNTAASYRLAVNRLKNLLDSANERADVGGDAHNTLTLRPGEEDPTDVEGGFKEDDDKTWQVLSDKKWHFRSAPRRVFSFTD